MIDATRGRCLLSILHALLAERMKSRFAISKLTLALATALPVVVGLLGLPNLGHGAELVSTFNFDLEGWTGNHGTIAHVPSGGNPGGYLAETDADDDFMQVLAPPAFMGNLSAFLGGTLSFDALNVNGDAPNSPDLPQFGTVIITGSAGIATLGLAGMGDPAADGIWHTYTAPINSGEPLLASVLADVTQIQLILESHIGVSEVVGIDNFRLISVPEPSTLVFAAIGTGCLCLVARRRIRQG